MKKNVGLVLIFLALTIFWTCTQQEQDVAVSSVTLSQPTAEMIIGETITLKATISPTNATDKQITWASSKQSVASVNQNGKVEALSEGVSTITATAGGKTGSCTITVSKGIIAVESIELDRQELTMVEGDEFTLKATVKPDDASDKTVSWSTSDSKIASVDNTGKITAIKEGEATIIAKAGEKTAECKVSISAKKIDVTMVMLSKTTLSMIVGDEFTLTATVIPDNATVKTVQWSTSDSSIATVEEGKVKAIKEGNAKIVAYVDGKTAECDVTVDYIPVQRITFDKTAISLYEGEDYTITATISPENATYKDITWTTNDPKIVTVEDGKVFAVKKGTATIKAEANGKNALCQIQVLSSIAEISLDKNELSMIVGDTETLTAVITPADATLREKITWTTSDDKVATVDENGKVKAIKEGSAIISAMVEGKKAECIVTVDYIHVSTIDISQTEATMYIGDAVTLTATLSPSNVTYDTIEWVSSNNDVVTVSQTGKVTAVGKGTATVSAKSDGKEAKCSFTVLVPLSTLSFDQNSLTLFKGESSTLSIIKSPSYATLKGEINWNSSNTAVATITDKGLVTAIKSGTANITASVDGCTATCSVTVLESVTGISLSESAVTINKGESITLSYSVIPAGATLRGDVSWVSSAPSVATVDNQGNVKAIGAGIADITVSLEGYTATCRITVVIPVSSVSLDRTSLALNKGESATLTATVNPSDATDKTVTWTSSDSNVASVKDGIVTAKKSGQTTITASCGGKTATCTVSVTTPVSSISLDRTTVALEEEQSTTLIATVSPNDADDKTVTWSSSNSSIATVNSNGKVYAVKEGQAVITATAGAKSARCTVMVSKKIVPVTSVSLDRTSLSLIKGETATLIATVSPSDATDKNVTWTSSDATIASVDLTGKVTALAGGNVTIKAAAGEKFATCTVTITVPVSSVSLDHTSLALNKGESATLTATINPSDATDKTVTWKTSNASVVTVANGVVKAIGGGVATVTVEASGKTATCAVNVTVPVSSLSLNITSKKLKQNETVQLSATVGPNDATDKTVSWTSSNTNVAVVDSAGKVKALTEGSAVITAKAGDKTATCSIIVSNTTSGGHEGTGFENWD